jgi:hypothetical protein
VRQETRRHESVAAVVARPCEDENVVGFVASRFTSERGTRVLHQLFGRNAEIHSVSIHDSHTFGG